MFHPIATHILHICVWATSAAHTYKYCRKALIALSVCVLVPVYMYEGVYVHIPVMIM